MSVFDVPLVEPMTYAGYRSMIDRLLAEGRTTGGDQTEATLDYAKLNVQRMNRLDLITGIVDELKAALAGITRAQTWLVLTEGWCGDAAQTVPMIAKAAALSERVTLRLILRDKNLCVMDRFLTNGTRSIPILVVIDDATQTVRGVWGPRPEPAKALVAEFKKDPNWNKDNMLTALHTWYARDKTVSAQLELARMLTEAEKWTR
jgi:hypothetical protein